MNSKNFFIKNYLEPARLNNLSPWEYTFWVHITIINNYFGKKLRKLWKDLCSGPTNANNTHFTKFCYISVKKHLKRLKCNQKWKNMFMWCKKDYFWEKNYLFKPILLFQKFFLHIVTKLRAICSNTLHKKKPLCDEIMTHGCFGCIFSLSGKPMSIMLRGAASCPGGSIMSRGAASFPGGQHHAQEVQNGQGGATCPG